MHEPLHTLFRQHFGTSAESAVTIAGDGSPRRYYRLVGPGGVTAVGAVGPDREENHAFLSYSGTFREAGFPVPEIYAADEATGVWLLQDLGDTTLFRALQQARWGGGAGSAEPAGGSVFPADMLSVYEDVVRWLPRFQIEGGKRVDYSVAYPRAAFDRQSILWDLNYFKYHFLKLAQIPFNEGRLEKDFGRLTRFLLQADTSHFLYRDFQSRNVMLLNGDPWFIDYQGGRRGALQYDIASLLYDAKADIPESIREDLLELYLEVVEGYGPVDRAGFVEHYRGYVLVRIMQSLGAYGYRGFFERKPRFLQSVPYAARNLAALLTGGLPLRVRELEAVFERIAERWGDEGSESSREGLTVYITSFSFLRGYPEDRGGHGGGHVFDCRGLPNPGRDSALAGLTGLDDEVIAHIQRTPEFEVFETRVHELMDVQIEEYVRRGFHSLSVSFGCTGGQHRSVYMAERLAEHVSQAFPAVHVDLVHRERAHWPAWTP